LRPGPPRLQPVRLAVGLVSGAAIAYQLLLMRLFSVVQWHHFAYMVISLALLGYAASGALLTILRRPFLARFELSFVSFAALFGVLAPACFAAAQRLRLNPLEVAWDGSQFVALTFVYLLLALPFVCAGSAVGLALARFEVSLHRVYSADLVGAAAGAASALAMLWVLPPATCLRLVGTAGGLAAATSGKGAARLLGAVAIGTALLWPSASLEPRMSEYKTLSKVLEVPGSEIVAERSSPLAKLTAVRSPTVPFRLASGLSFAYVGEIPDQIVVFSDGEVTAVIDRNAELDELLYLDYLPSALPYQLPGWPAGERSVALLGAAIGGRVASALSHDALEVHAVAANPQLEDLVESELATFTGRLHDDPRITSHTLDSRGFLSHHQGKLDLIELPPADTGAAPGSHSLEESYAHTVEAFRLAFDLLTPEGALSFGGELAAPPRASVKLLATVGEALERAGLDPRRHLAVIRSWNRFQLLVKRTSLTAADVAAIRQFCAERSFDIAWYPGMRPAEANRFNLLQRPILFEAAQALLGPRREDFIESYKLHVSPATDDRPYFFRSFRWRGVAELLRLRTRGGASLVEWSYVLLIATVAQASAAGLVLVLLPLWIVRRRLPVGSGGGRVGLYFLCLGLAFLFLEIAFIQRLTLFLAHPLRAVAVVLAGCLLFAGLGSGASTRFQRRWPRAPIRSAVGAIVSIALATLALTPTLFARAADWALPLKLSLALLAIAPLAFFLGMPFPLALRRVAATRPQLVPWAWGVNGWASVLAAVLATLLAVHFGFRFVVVAACALYLLAATVAPRASS
jgi:hypothetical protein